MRSIQKRGLAWLLLVTMLVGMCSFGGAAAATTSGTDHVFNFRKLYYGPWSDSAYAPDYVTSFDMTTSGNASEINTTYRTYVDGTYVTNTGIATDPWMFDSASEDATYGWSSSSGAYGPYFTGSVGAYVAYRVRVGTSGTYRLIPRFSPGPFGGTVKYYLAPSTASDPRAEEYYCGSIDNYSATIIADKEEQLCIKSLTAGDYILSYVLDTPNASTSGSGHYFTNAFLMTAYTPIYEIAGDAVVMTEGEEQQQELQLTMDGTAVGFSDVSAMRVASSKSDVATASLTRSADGSRVYLSVYGQSAGSASVIVSVTLGGSELQASIPVTVSAAESKLALVSDHKDSYTVSAGSSESFTLTAEYNGSSMSFQNISLVASAADSSVLSTSVAKKDDGSAVISFVGLKEGTTQVIVSAYYEGNAAKFTVPVSVTPRVDRFTYNFLKLHYGQYSNQGYDPKTITSFDMTTAGHVNEIVPSVYSDPWKFDSLSEDSTLQWTSSSGGNGPAWVAEIGGWCRYQIRVPENGVFSIETVHCQNPAFGNVTYYLAPVDAFDPVSEMYSLGEVTGYATTAKTDVSKVLQQRYMNAGDYVLTLVMTSKNSAITASLLSFMTREIRLVRPQIGVPYAVMDVNGAIPVGTTEQVEIKLEKDGVAVDASTADFIRVTSGKRSVATASITYSDDGERVYASIKGRAVGTTGITVTASVGGVSFTNSRTVVVKDAGALDFAEVSVDDSDLNAGEQTQVYLTAYALSGDEIDPSELGVTYSSSDTTIASVDASGLVTAHNQGTAEIQVHLDDGSVAVDLKPILVNVTGYSKLESAVIANTEMVPVGNTLALRVTGRLEYGAVMPENSASVTYTLVSASPSGAATLSNGVLTGVAAGTVTVRATVTFDGTTVTTADKILSIRSGKTRSSYYTEEKRAIAQENAQKYSWASDQIKSITSAAEYYVGKEEELWNLITTQELPRNIRVGYRYDPNHYICRYCKTDIVSIAGSNYAYSYNAISNPWKVQCPSCRRNFPSNDFEKFYKSGIDANGNWSYALAKQNGSAYLTNDLYPEMGTGWGVDDGYGYRTGTYFNTGTGETWEETHTYIAYYNHWALWYSGYLLNVMSTTANAYVFSGDERYGRVAAVLVDRIADIYPAMDTGVYDPKYWNNGWFGGKILGGIWETGVVSSVAKAYDAVFDMYDDPTVIAFLSDKASKYNMTNKKTTGNAIRQNIDDNFLREAMRSLYNRKIAGNWGYHHSAAADVAVVLDTMPETKEILDWMLDGTKPTSTLTSDYQSIYRGSLNAGVLANVSRDGAGNESSPSYNYGWAASMYDVADTLAGYDRYSKADLYTNPKIIKMFKMNFPLTLMRKTTAHIGDKGGVDTQELSLSAGDIIPAFLQTGDVELGQMIYFLNGNNSAGVFGSIFTDSSELQAKVQAVIDEHGEYPFDKSMQLTDYGFAILRNGTKTSAEDTQQDFWLKYGSTQGHGHPAKLNLGIDAFGLCLAPDMGYPSTTLGTNDIYYWETSTIIHNTVQVNDTKQTRNYSNETPLHFDDDGRVKVMDVDASSAYDATSIYRRSVVMVDAGDGNSYGVDFFRVKGGNSHVYSFHALSDSVAETSGLNLVAQSGTYAGTSVAYGPGNVTSGYDSFTSVMKDSSPSAKFAIDFAIKDFRGHATKEGDLHLRMTMINNFQATDVATALGRPPIINSNPSWLQFALVRRTGSNLDSLFTTVFEPYADTRFITLEEEKTMARIGGATPGANDVAKAIKITMANGRVDYIMYATNNQVKYRVNGMFDFMGTFGVCSYINNKLSYAYLNDGTLIGPYSMSSASYTGKVTGFTTGLAFDNYIQVSFDQAVDFNDLVGRFIDINNSGIYNASYEIKGVTKLSATTAKLHIGDVTLLRGSLSSYDIATGMTFSIPRSASFEVVEEPEVEVDTLTFDPVDEQIAAYGRAYDLQVRATSTSGEAISYEMTSGPEGAVFDPLTRTLSWTPTEFGDFSATFAATSGNLNAQITVPIKVRGAAPDLILGAQIRLVGDQGVRFIANMDRSTLNALEEAGATEIEYGVLLIPSADVQNMKEIVLDAVLNGHSVARVPAVYLYNITETNYMYTAVITNIAEKNFGRAYTARTYLKYRDGNGDVQTVYGNSSVSRSIYQVAKAALNDSGRYSETELATLQAIVDVVEG